MTNSIVGKAWVFGDHVNTDAMAPGPTALLDWPERRLSLFPERPGVSMKMEKGDLIIAGANWGCGSSREQAVTNMKELGVAAIIAKSFARIFLRNAIAHALPVFIAPDIRAATSEGDEIEVSWETYSIKNHSQNRNFEAIPYTDEMRRIVTEGGMLPLIKAHAAKKT